MTNWQEDYLKNPLRKSSEPFINVLARHCERMRAKRSFDLSERGNLEMAMRFNLLRLLHSLKLKSSILLSLIFNDVFSFALTFLVLSLPTPSLAAAWTLDENKAELINNFFINRIDKFYDRAGKLTSQPSFMKYEYKPYFEYGLYDDLTLGFSPSLQSISSEDVSDGTIDTNYGLVFTEIFARKRFYKEDTEVASVEIGAEAPGFYSTRESPGFGKKDIFGSAKISYGNGNNDYFVNLDSALRMRASESLDFSDQEAGVQSISSGKVGARFFKNYQVILGMSYTKSISDYTNFSNTARYGFDVLRSEINLIKHFRGASVSLGVIDDLYGKNVGKSEMAIISVSKKF